MMENTDMENRARKSLYELQFKGSFGDSEGTGSCSVRPSEVIRYTLPWVALYSRPDLFSVMVELDEEVSIESVGSCGM
jgi:hypothetical protein